MSRRKPRQLRADEEALWDRVAKTTRPFHPDRPEKAARVDLGAAPTKKTKAKFELSAFEIGSHASADSASVGQTPAPRTPSLNMNRGTYQRMKRGKTKPEARIDLHGMTANDAYAALVSYLFEAQASSKRLALVITGKGRPGTSDSPIPTRTGVLRRSLPEWLGRPPLRAIVQQYTEAHQRHGGSGAFYVYLKRLR